MLGQENQGAFAYQSRLFPQGGLSSRQKRKLLSTLVGFVMCFALLPTELLFSVGLAALSFYLDNWKGLTYTNAAKKSGIFFGMMGGASLIILCISGVAIVCCKGASLCLWPCRRYRRNKKLTHQSKRHANGGDETELFAQLVSDDGEEDDDEFSPYRPTTHSGSDPVASGGSQPLSTIQPINSIQW